jgi:hypothetical protein
LSRGSLQSRRHSRVPNRRLSPLWTRWPTMSSLRSGGSGASRTTEEDPTPPASGRRAGVICPAIGRAPVPQGCTGANGSHYLVVHGQLVSPARTTRCTR